MMNTSGVEATSELKHEAGRVLFTVTPKEKGEALEHVRRALDIYLLLPADPDLNISPGVMIGIRSRRLVANIQHLHGQLMLAKIGVKTPSLTKWLIRTRVH